jgi:hypothetical protein
MAGFLQRVWVFLCEDLIADAAGKTSESLRRPDTRGGAPIHPDGFIPKLYRDWRGVSLACVGSRRRSLLTARVENAQRRKRKTLREQYHF